MKSINFLLTIMGVFLTMGCGSIKVVSHQTPHTDLSDYQTYNIVSNENFSGDNMKEKDKIETAILNKMDQLGYNFQQTSDLLVDYHLILGSATSVSQSHQTYPYRGNFYRYNTIDVSRYHEGILLIEIKESDKKRIIWQGSLDLKYNRRSKTKRDIAELISLIFDTFPAPIPNNK